MTRTMVILPAATGAALLLNACLVQRTVTDESGHLIYQEPEIHTPFESEAKKDREVEEATRALGW